MHTTCGPGGRRNVQPFSLCGGRLVCFLCFSGLRYYTTRYTSVHASLRELLLHPVCWFGNCAELGDVFDCSINDRPSSEVPVATPSPSCRVYFGNFIQQRACRTSSYGCPYH